MRRLSALLVGLLILVTSKSTLAAATSFHRGVDGEMQVTLPWGNYVFYDEGGGRVWTGKETEFNRLKKTVGLDKRSKATRNDVDRTFNLDFGDISIKTIGCEILFDVDPHNPPRPKIPSSSEYVAVMWVQLPDENIANTALVDEKSRAVFAPYYVHQDTVDDESGSAEPSITEEYVLPRSELTRPMDIVFMASDQPPGVVAIRSIAWAQYENYTAGGVMVDNIPDVRHLVQLDRNLNAESDASLQPAGKLRVRNAKAGASLQLAGQLRAKTTAAETARHADRGCNADAQIDHLVEPQYPDEAREQGAVGTAIVMVSMNAQGHVTDAVISKSTDNDALDKAALEAARSTTYLPSIVSCKPISGRYTFQADFSGE